MDKIETLDSQIKYALERLLSLTIGGGSRAAIEVHVKSLKEYYARRTLAVVLAGGQ
jgi:hypothetical protein